MEALGAGGRTGKGKGRRIEDDFVLGSSDEDDEGDGESGRSGDADAEHVPLQTLRGKRERDLEQGLG